MKLRKIAAHGIPHDNTAQRQQPATAHFPQRGAGRRAPNRWLARADSAQLLAQHMAERRRIRNGIFAFFAVLGVLGFLIGKWFEGR